MRIDLLAVIFIAEGGCGHRTGILYGETPHIRHLAVAGLSPHDIHTLVAAARGIERPLAIRHYNHLLL